MGQTQADIRHRRISGSGESAQQLDQSSEAPEPPPLYTPFRAFLGWALISTAATLAAVRAASDDAGADAYARLGQLVGDNWLGRLVGRLGDDPFKIFILLAFVAALVYGIIQRWALTVDRRSFRDALRTGRSGGVYRRLVAAISGRPGALYRNRRTDRADAASRQATLFALDRHVAFGRPALGAPLQAALWAFPILGFLGTVAGLADAIRLLPEATGGGAIELVLAELYLAFDTTMLGLLAALCVYPLVIAQDQGWTRIEALETAWTSTRWSDRAEVDADGA